MKNTKNASNQNFGKGKSSWNKGIPHSTATKTKISNSMLGENAPNFGKKEEESSGWKENARKSALHKWVIRNKGKARDHTCVFCGRRKAEDWANKKHDYKRVLDDYLPLCRKCHRLFDNRDVLFKTFTKILGE